MTEEDAEELFNHINLILRNHQLIWLADQIATEAADGRASQKLLSVQDDFDTFVVDEIRPRFTRRRTEFTHVRPLTSKEKVDVSIKSLRSILVSSGQILPKVLETIVASPEVTFTFVSETDAPVTTLSEADAARFSAAATSLDGQLNVVVEEVHRGS
jgi:hypothetical protein